MKRVAKILIVALGFIVLSPIVAFFAYDVLAFQPHRSEIQAILARADPEDRSPPPQIRRFIIASHGKGSSPATHAARLLVTRFSPSRPGQMIGWHTRFAIWECLVRLHLTTDEIFGIYTSLSNNGHGQGSNAIAMELFSRPLSALTEQEAATVVAVLWAPAYYLRDRKRLEGRRDFLLSRARKGT